MTSMEQGAPIAPMPAFERLNVFKLLAFTFLTGGLYACYWLHKVRPEFAKIGPFHAVSDRLTYMYDVLAVIVLLTSFSPHDKLPLKHSPQFAPYVAACVVLTIIVFRMRAALHAHFEERLGLFLPSSIVLTFLFNIFYIQHVINQGLKRQETVVQAQIGALSELG